MSQLNLSIILIGVEHRSFFWQNKKTEDYVNEQYSHYNNRLIFHVKN